MISVRGLRKHYQVHQRPPGLRAALRSLVHRTYTTAKAVDGISFDIRPGERVGFLGPNGAGKTTTLLVMGQKQQLLWDLPPAETFELNRAIYDVPVAQYKQTMDELVALLDLGELISKPTRQLSLGERMKCELAAALGHRPRVPAGLPASSRVGGVVGSGVFAWVARRAWPRSIGHDTSASSESPGERLPAL